MMDINHIFGLFENQQPTYDSGNEDSVRLYELFKEHPLVKIGMFKKIILNYEKDNDIILNLFRMDESLNIPDVKKAGDYLVYHRAWEFIVCIELDNKFHMETLDSVSNKDLSKCLEISLKYFEKIEEYEKCAFLLSLKEKVMNNLK